MKKSEREELVKYRITKAKLTLHELKILIDNKLWNTAVNRLYYACYYAISALLIHDEINAHTHSGVRQMFGLHYIKTGKISKESGKFFTDIFDLRHTGDYDDFIDFNEVDVMDLIKPAKELIQTIEKML